ncbi:MAG: hypothetical protein IPG38_00010 [Chitinophagaceae bacterium]|nr:hypothetical protein [Chitinophagaceae bacterium]
MKKIADKILETEIIQEDIDKTATEINYNEGFLKYYSNTTKEYQQTLGCIEELNNKLKIFDIEKGEINATKNFIKNELVTIAQKISQLNKDFNKIYKIAKCELFKSKIPVVKNGTKIFFIDDNAENGWLEIFKNILPDEMFQNIFTISN